MPKIIHSMSKIVEKVYDIFCLKKFVCEILFKRRMLSTQPRRKIFEKRPKVLRSMSKSVWKTWIYSQKKQFSSECYYGCVDCIFHNLTDSFSLKAQKSFAKGPYWYKRIFFLQKKISHRYNRWDTKHAVFTTSRINFRQKAKTFAHGPKMITKKFSPEKSFYP